MEAIVLAGGAGTRLRSVVNDLPKPMADVAGRPFLAYLLDYLVSAGVKRVVLSVGYRREQIMQWFGERYRDLTIVYAIEDEPLGTGGAIRESLHLISGDDLLIMNGDTFFPIDLGSMAAEHLHGSCGLTMALKLMHDFDRYGTVSCSEQRVTGFSEKGFRSKGYINGGVYLMHRTLVDEFPQMRRFSLESDFLEPMVKRIMVCPFISDAYFIDIGIPEDYQRAQIELPLQMGEFR